ncbi:PQQ-dependent dehydrogenase, methanol/ethanol family [Variovorax sp. Root411]|uniref:PQQ-dependent dehydrogenase, methanol/ethanol family n=1 Tax=Variovorax sp. Root411 TaxID=1736530 RepID=UPI000AF125F4|nr:PQQ-dependent dehydrogenase, methanol/ethanol family [Variovorax sp. Root411]
MNNDQLETHLMKHSLQNGFLTLAVACALAVVSSQSALAADVNAERLRNAAKEPGNWMTVGGTYAEARYSTLNQINSANVGRLKLAWYADLETNRGQEATPLVIDGVLYTSTSWSRVHAYDAASGKELWKYDPKVPGSKGAHACCDVVNRGLAAWNGKIYVGTLDGRLEALDAKSGKVVWSTPTFDPKTVMTITGAPRVVKGKVLIGQGGAEYGARGFLGAYDAETGKPVWRFYMTPNPENKPDGAASDKVLMTKAFSTWGEGVWKQSGGGATPWDSIVYDQEFDQVIVGTGNSNPWSSKARGGGDNLFVGSVLALNPDTGEYKWHYQQTPGDDWDFTSTQPIILTELKIDNAMRKVLLHAPKNGFFYVIDRKDGKLISAEKFASVNWASGIDLTTGRPIEYPAARYTKTGQRFVAMPAAFGSHNWHPMAHSPKTGLTYIPVQDIPLDYAVDSGFKFTEGVWNLGIASQMLAGPQSESDRKVLAMQTRGFLLAWDPVKQKEAWRVQHPNVASAGVLATAGNLVFQGTPDGRFVAYKADTGGKVWSWQGFDGIIAGAMSYAVAGEQYIAVLSGFGGANALHVPSIQNPKVGLNGRVLVFKLDGKAIAPDNSRPLLAPNVPTEVWPTEIVSKGAALYGNCAGCHGFGTYGHNAIPDLRRSQMLGSRPAWEAIILGGGLESKGMPGWSGTLKPEDVEAIRAYIADRARVLRDDERVDAQGRR